jgi:hypothetical protein
MTMRTDAVTSAIIPAVFQACTRREALWDGRTAAHRELENDAWTTLLLAETTMNEKALSPGPEKEHKQRKPDSQ